MSDETPMRLPQVRLHYDSVSEHKSDNNSESDTQSVASEQPERKRRRYLSDIDRSIIIQRLEKGEKQADLAREFGVTRAAISHINKHKDELLTRFDEFARTPQGRVLIENYSRPSTEFENLIEVRTPSATVLTTRIKNKATNPRNFRAAADRLIRLLLEEALVSFGSAEPFTNQGIEVATTDSPLCAVALEREGVLMVSIFQEMEPNATTGSIRGSDSHSENNGSNWQVLTVDLPDSIASKRVMLLVPILVSASLASAAVEELRARCISLSSIGLVCVSCAFDAARDMATRQPEVPIITAAIDRHADETEDLLDSFVQRYYASRIETTDS